MDVLGSQPPSRKGHLRQCLYHALEARTSLNIVVKICIGTKVCDYLVGKSEGDGFADGHAEPVVVNTRAFDPVRGQGDLGHVF